MGREPQAWSLHRDPRTGTFTVRFRLKGRRYHRSTGCRGAREAARAAREIYEKEAGSVSSPQVVPAPEGDLQKLIVDWIKEVQELRSKEWADTLRLYAAAHWMRRWSNLDELTSEAIQRYIGERLRAPGRAGGRLSPITLHKELSGLSGFLRWCKRRSILAAVPTWEAPERTSDYEPICLTEEQIAAVLAELPSRGRHKKHHPVLEYYTLAWETSLRHGTLARLRWSDVDLDVARLLVRSGADKAKEQRWVPLTPAAVAALRSLAPGIGLVFGAHDWRASLRAAARRAKLPEEVAARLTDHPFRHSRLTAWAEQGAPLLAMQHMSGHRQLSTLQRYLHASERAAREMITGGSSVTSKTGFRDTSRDTEPNQPKKQSS